VSRALTAGIHIPPKMYTAVTGWVAMVRPQKIAVRQTVRIRKIPIACHGDTARSLRAATAGRSIMIKIVGLWVALGAACAPWLQPNP
jgi:hypothetical protein